MIKVSFDYLDEFERGAKALRKKYSSFEDDFDTFLNELEANPRRDTNLSPVTSSLSLCPLSLCHFGGCINA